MKTYYLEVNGKVEEEIPELEMEARISCIEEVFKNSGFKYVRVMLKENPVYDSFGNLWE